MKKSQISFLLIYTLTYPLRLLPFKAIHCLGRGIGWVLYYLSPKFRKRTLSNIALAKTLNLSNPEIRIMAKRSLQNLAITFLEYAKLDSLQDIKKIATCINPDAAEQLIQQGTPPIFFCGHQANWELLFLEGTSRMKGVAIGRPIQNDILYRFVLRIREKFGGKILPPKEAIKGSLKALKAKESFLGIVGDQGMPDSGYCSPFLGRKAWTSPMPALLSHRTGAPLIVATTKRTDAGHYLISYSDPIWPNREAPLDEEIDRLMRACLTLLEESIIKNPDEWLFSHNRWKQQTPGILKKPFRHESILIILPSMQEASAMGVTIEELFDLLSLLKEMYPLEFITLYTPLPTTPIACDEVITYSSKRDLFKEDLRFKLVFNFTPHLRLSSHFKRLSAFTIVNLPCHLKKKTNSLSLRSYFKNLLCHTTATT